MEMESGNYTFESHWKLLDDHKTVQCKICNLRLNHRLDQNLLDSHVAWHQKAAQLKLRRTTKQQKQTKNNSWKVSASKAVERKKILLKKVNNKRPILQVLVSEKKNAFKVEDIQPENVGLSAPKVKWVKCLTCPLKTTMARTISVMQMVFKENFKTILLLITGVEASEKDVICMACSKKAMQAFEFREIARNQDKKKISEDESFATSVKYDYKVDFDFKPKIETIHVSDDDHNDKDNFDDDFRFSDLDEDIPLQTLTKATTAESKLNGQSKSFEASNEKTICEPAESKTESKSTLPKTVKTSKTNRDRSALTVKCIQCSETFSQCLQLLHHVRVAHGKSVSVSESKQPKKLVTQKSRTLASLLRNSKINAARVKQKYVKKVKTSQTVEMTFRCGVCYSLFIDGATLETHLRDHKDTEAIMCGVCSRVYHKFSHFKRHFSTHHPEETNIIEAEATETLLEIEKEEVRRQLVQYIRMTTIGDLVAANFPLLEEKEIRFFAHACGLCGELSVSPEQLEEHKNKVHAAELPTRCFICGITYGAGDTVGLYHNLNCRKRALTNECVICGVKMRSAQVLEGHVQMQHPHQFADWEKRYCNRKCDRCGGEFSSRDSLRHHRRVVCPEDDQVGEFSCDKCKKKFRVKYYLIKHMERVHDRPQEMHVCPVCGKLVRKLNTHMTVHSGEKPYKCRFCPTAFRVSHERTYHERKHTQDSPYKCIPCNRLFTRPASHKRHMMQHTGERPHKCTMCDSAFIQKNCLVAHMKKHTPYDQSLPLDPRPFDEPPPEGAEVEIITEEHSDTELDWSAKKKRLSTYW